MMYNCGTHHPSQIKQERWCRLHWGRKMNDFSVNYLKAIQWCEQSELKKNQYASHGAEMENKLDFTPTISTQTKPKTPNRFILLVSKRGHFSSSRMTPRRALTLFRPNTVIFDVCYGTTTAIRGTWSSLYKVIMNNNGLFQTHLIYLIKNPPWRPQAKPTEGEQRMPNSPIPTSLPSFQKGQ